MKSKHRAEKLNKEQETSMKRKSMKRKFMVEELGKEISVRFFYGEKNEENPKLSYTKEIRRSNGQVISCRFVECRIEQVNKDGYTPLAVATAYCSPSDPFTKRSGRIISLNRALESITEDKSLRRKIRVFAIGDLKAISRYKAIHGLSFKPSEENEAVSS